MSDNAHFVERLRQTGPDRIESDITITDPETLEQPWEVHMVYNRHPVLDRLVHEGDLLQNNRVVIRGGVTTIAGADEEAGPETAAPAAAPPPAPVQIVDLSAEQLDRVAGKYLLENPPFELTFERRGQRLFLRVDPVQPFFLPVQSVGAQEFVIGTAKFQFTSDAEGAVTGFTGTRPDGTPMKGNRKAS